MHKSQLLQIYAKEGHPVVRLNVPGLMTRVQVGGANMVQANVNNIMAQVIGPNGLLHLRL